jgi:hypothetical protein
MIWNFWLVLIGFLMLFAYYIDLFRRKSPVKGVIIKNNKINSILSVGGFLFVLVGYVSLFWVYKWWIPVLLILTIPIQNMLLLPIVVWIKVKLFDDNY